MMLCNVMLLRCSMLKLKKAVGDILVTVAFFHIAVLYVLAGAMCNIVGNVVLITCIL